MFIDSHCHLDFPDFSPRIDQVLADMAAAQVTHALTISVKLETCPQVIALADRYPNLYASVGVHPDEEDLIEPTCEQLLDLAAHPKVIAIGETGLDYYRNQNPDFIARQQARFVTHIEAANASGKPLVIHTRSAATDTLDLMRANQAQHASGVMHCFTESLPVALAAIELGFYISFSGIVTFKNAQALREVATAIPLERILIETDSPYLAPVPHRGKTNSPAYVPLVAAEIARLRGLTLEQVAQATTDNFQRLFKLSLN